MRICERVQDQLREKLSCLPGLACKLEAKLVKWGFLPTQSAHMLHKKSFRFHNLVRFLL